MLFAIIKIKQKSATKFNKEVHNYLETEQQSSEQCMDQRRNHNEKLKVV